MDPGSTWWSVGFVEFINKRIRRGLFRSLKELEAAIRQYIDVYRRSQTLCFTADQILASIAR